MRLTHGHLARVVHLAGLVRIGDLALVIFLDQLARQPPGIALFDDWATHGVHIHRYWREVAQQVLIERAQFLVGWQRPTDVALSNHHSAVENVTLRQRAIPFGQLDQRAAFGQRRVVL